MSAIYGIINKNKQPVEQDSINKIKRALAHRGTDGQSRVQNENIAFGFCKLSVYPQQQNEQLPIETADLIFTADARIDNRNELYSLLNLDKQQWHHEADSALILKAYQKWGGQCVDHLEGDFAFAVWDKVSQQLFLATDPIGYRPVFYYDGPEQFIFCSEIKGIEAAKTTPDKFNEVHLINYHFRNSDNTETYNTEILALLGGTMLTLNKGKAQVNRYWTLENKGLYKFNTDAEWIACMRELMYRAIEKRLNTDVPVGVTLSGGLDSSSVACILSELLAKKNKPLYAFSSVLPVNHSGIEQDERQYIDLVNKKCPNIIQTFVEAPGIGPFDNVADAFIKDEAIPNAFFYMDHAILEAAKQKGVKTVFGGFGGDFWVSWKGNSVLNLLVRQGHYRMAWQLLKQLSENNNGNRLQIIKSDHIIYTEIWQQLRKLKPKSGIDWQQHSALNPDFFTKHDPQYINNNQPDQRINMRQQLVEGRVGRIMGMFANRASWYNIASADPLFDKQLMEFLMEVPPHLFNHNGWRRSLIRHAMEGVLPPGIQWRRDKLPYNPDFAQRSIDSKDKLYAMMTSTQHSFIFDNYLSREVIYRHFDNIKPFKGFSSPTAVAGLRITQAGIAYEVLSWLKENNYQF